MWTIVDSLASEYGWTKDYILFEVSPLEYYSILGPLKNRKVNEFIDTVESRILADPTLEGDAKSKALNSLNGLRPGATVEDEKLDRKKLNKLREFMARKKGPGPVRAN